MKKIDANILIAEDEAITALDLKMQLSKFFEKVRVVEYGEDLITIATYDKPDTIISDITLAGEMDGIEALYRICESNSIPYIFISAYPEYQKVIETYQLNPYKFLHKPIKMEVLVKDVKNCLRKMKESNKS